MEVVRGSTVALCCPEMDSEQARDYLRSLVVQWSPKLPYRAISIVLLLCALHAMTTNQKKFTDEPETETTVLRGGRVG